MVCFRAILILFILFSAGCAGTTLQKARSEFFLGNPDRANHILEDCKGIQKKNLLLCYMEKGLILYDLKSYEESTEAFLKASRLMEKQDMVNISDQSSAVLINDGVMAYKGEYSERLWVHTFLMMNFLFQNRYDSALVEAKQALEVFDEYPEALADAYFTRALIALCYENMNLPDDARIEYEKLAEAMGGDNIIPKPIPRGKGELVLFIGQGRIPVKTSIDIVAPRSTRVSIPRYDDSSTPQPVRIREDGLMQTALQVTTDLGDVARKSLNDRAAQYLTRQALRAGVKETIAQEVGDKNELAEAAVRLLLFFIEEADTRSWESLPGGMSLVRIILDSGRHDLEISSEYSGTIYLDGIDIPEGKRLYRALRF